MYDLSPKSSRPSVRSPAHAVHDRPGVADPVGGVEVGPLQVGIDKLQHPRQIALSEPLIGGANDGLVRRRNSTPGASPAAPGAYCPATRPLRVRVKGSRFSAHQLSLHLTDRLKLFVSSHPRTTVPSVALTFVSVGHGVPPHSPRRPFAGTGSMAFVHRLPQGSYAMTAASVTLVSRRNMPLSLSTDRTRRFDKLKCHCRGGSYVNDRCSIGYLHCSAPHRKQAARRELVPALASAVEPATTGLHRLRTRSCGDRSTQ